MGCKRSRVDAREENSPPLRTFRAASIFTQKSASGEGGAVATELAAVDGGWEEALFASPREAEVISWCARRGGVPPPPTTTPRGPQRAGRSPANDGGEIRRVAAHSTNKAAPATAGEGPGEGSEGTKEAPRGGCLSVS